MAALPSPPVTMLINGVITAGSGVDSTAPKANDLVLVFNAINGQYLGSGPVSAKGSYFAIISIDPSFNGTPIVLELQQGTKRYQLLKEGKPMWARFFGRTLPEKTPPQQAQVGSMTVELPKKQSDNPQAQRLSQHPNIPCLPEMDVNSDGECNAADWAILQLFSGGVTRSVGSP